jgi:hypothetical protein
MIPYLGRRRIVKDGQDVTADVGYWQLTSGSPGVPDRQLRHDGKLIGLVSDGRIVLTRPEYRLEEKR